MRYKSTRGGCRSSVSFAQAVQSGYALDGGLYVPEALPKIGIEELSSWRSLGFPALAAAVIGKFASTDEVEPGELLELAHRCYDGFDAQGILPVRRVGNIFVAELFHGPTFCFKDFGQQPLLRLLAYFAKKEGSKLTALVSTTGDTGPAAMRAVADCDSPALRMIVFFPEGQISEMQRRQMTTMVSPKVRVMSFEGGGDDMDVPLKRMAADQTLAAKHRICGINSYNIGRPVAQMPHYFWTYFRVLEQCKLDVGAEVDFVLPTGAMGNIAAGMMAKQCGLPVGRFVAGVNANDITHRTFQHGSFHRSDGMKKTLSEAINVQVPYNMERILYYLVGENSQLVQDWMSQIDSSGRLILPSFWLGKLKETFSSSRIDDPTMLATIRCCLDNHGYLLDPHSAVGMAAALDHYPYASSCSRPVALLATASPCKFEAAVTEAIGVERWKAYAASSEFPDAARELMSKPEVPFVKLKAGKVLAASQDEWEASVRLALEGNAVESFVRARL